MTVTSAAATSRDEVVADQDQTDQPVRPLEQLLGRARAAAALAREMAQPIAVDAHQRGLGAREERRQHDQQQQNEELIVQW